MSLLFIVEYSMNIRFIQPLYYEQHTSHTHTHTQAFKKKKLL